MTVRNLQSATERSVEEKPKPERKRKRPPKPAAENSNKIVHQGMTAAQMDAQRDRIIREIQAEWTPAIEYSRRVQKSTAYTIPQTGSSLARTVQPKATAKIHDQDPRQ